MVVGGEEEAPPLHLKNCYGRAAEGNFVQGRREGAWEASGPRLASGHVLRAG